MAMPHQLLKPAIPHETVERSSHPASAYSSYRQIAKMTDSMSKPSTSLGLTLEAWSQGFMIGAVVIMIGITLANMRRVLLHKLILVEVCDCTL